MRDRLAICGGLPKTHWEVPHGADYRSPLLKFDFSQTIDRPRRSS
jgi:hypothetical protein